jgi:hypothetical protein
MSKILNITRENKSIFDTNFINDLNNEQHIYMTDEIIKLKCVDDFDLTNKSYDLIIGQIYTGNVTTSDHYYFIHETRTVLPSELLLH